MASILGGLISWIGDRMKLTMAMRTELLELSIEAMMSSIFYAPLVGIGESLEKQLVKDQFRNRVRKIILYTITTIAGVSGFTLVKYLFPNESVFTIRIPAVDWDVKVLLTIFPALIVGIGFGYLFQLFEKYSEIVAKKNQTTNLVGSIGRYNNGNSRDDFAVFFLFSGEHELLGFSKDVVNFGLPYILLLAIGKALLTNLCFAFGWRGGKIFPAIFAGTAMGFALAELFPYTPGLIVGIVVAASVTIIINQPYVTAALLLFLFPIQLFPFIIAACLLTNKFSKSVKQVN